MEFTAEKVFNHQLTEFNRVDIPALASDPVNITPEFVDKKVKEIFIKVRGNLFLTVAADVAGALQNRIDGKVALFKNGETESFYNTSDNYIFAYSQGVAITAGIDKEVYRQGVIK